MSPMLFDLVLKFWARPIAITVNIENVSSVWRHDRSLENY